MTKDYAQGVFSALLIFAVNCYYAHPLLMEWLRRGETEPLKPLTFI